MVECSKRLDHAPRAALFTWRQHRAEPLKRHLHRGRAGTGGRAGGPPLTPVGRHDRQTAYGDCALGAPQQRVLVEGGGCIEAVKVQATPVVVTTTETLGASPYRHRCAFRAHTSPSDRRGALTFDRPLVGRPKHGEHAAFSPHAGADTPRYRPRRLILDDHERKRRRHCSPGLAPCATGVRDSSVGVAESDRQTLQGMGRACTSTGQVGCALCTCGLVGHTRQQDGTSSPILASSLLVIWSTRLLVRTVEFDLGIVPFADGWRAADLHRRALEYSLPPAALATDPVENPLGASWALFIDSAPDVLLASLYVYHGDLDARAHEVVYNKAAVAYDRIGPPVSMTETDSCNRSLARSGHNARLHASPIRIVNIVKKDQGHDVTA
jgi:hypothetical protein